MTLNRTGNTNGGTSSINLPVIRRYTFTDVGPGGHPPVFIDRLETFTASGINSLRKPEAAPRLPGDVHRNDQLQRLCAGQLL